MYAGQYQFFMAGMHPVDTEVVSVFVSGGQMKYLARAAWWQVQVDAGVAAIPYAEVAAQGGGNGGDGIEQADKVDAGMG